MGTVTGREERKWQTGDGTHLRHPDKSKRQTSPKGGSRALDIMKTFILKTSSCPVKRYPTGQTLRDH